MILRVSTESPLKGLGKLGNLKLGLFFAFAATLFSTVRSSENSLILV